MNVYDGVPSCFRGCCTLLCLCCTQLYFENCTIAHGLLLLVLYSSRAVLTCTIAAHGLLLGWVCHARFRIAEFFCFSWILQPI